MHLLKDTDKLGTAGLFIIATLSPCCFPLFAFVATALGIGSYELFGGWTMWVFQALIIISILGLYTSYRKHKYLYPLLIAMFSGLLIFYGYHFNDSDYWTYFLYAGMLGLLAATIWNFKSNKIQGQCDTCETTYNGQSFDLKSTITCPKCGFQKEEIMPTEACQYFYECDECNTVLKPKQGDCCVFCSYGTVKCPPTQTNQSCC